MRSFLAVAAACAILTSAPDARACTCSPDTAEQARERADFVFEGRVVSQRPWHAVFEDVIVHRGEEAAAPLDITNGNDCPPVTLEDGERYLVYMPAHPSEQGAAVTYCGRVVLASEAADEIAALSVAEQAPVVEAPEPVAPAAPRPLQEAAPDSAPPPNPPAAGGCAGCATSEGSAPDAALLAVLLLGLAMRCRRR